jgi:hypothetical protein
MENGFGAFCQGTQIYNSAFAIGLLLAILFFLRLDLRTILLRLILRFASFLIL